jgi:ABC-type glycerol-3-phosphate transport system substrate-binding protein
MGDIPIGIADYFMYNTLINAAPEIENSWAISLVPGVPEVDENGNPVLDENGNQVINRMTAGAAQNSVIMKSDRTEKIVLTDGSTMERDQAAWEYLKWWMSTETQVEFGITLQTTYGKEFIWNTANIEAFKELPWKSRDKAIIVEQMHNIVETPRIPGTYMLERELSNAYIEVVIDGGTLRTAIDTAVKRINRETVRKLKEFGYLDEDGNIIKEYEIPSIEMVREILAKGKKK